MKNLISQIFDAVFIILLCFAVLFLTMTLTGRVASASRYSINVTVLLLIVIVIFFYFFLMIRTSVREFHEITALSEREGEHR